MDTHIYYKVKFDIRSQVKSYLFIVCFKYNLIKLFMIANIVKTQIFHKIMDDLEDYRKSHKVQLAKFYFFSNRFG